MFDKGFFGGLFDFNDDGKLDSFEKSMDFAMFCKVMEAENEEESDDDDF